MRGKRGKRGRGSHAASLPHACVGSPTRRQRRVPVTELTSWADEPPRPRPGKTTGCAGVPAPGSSRAEGAGLAVLADADAARPTVSIAAATVIGFGLGFTGIDAFHMLVWSAVLNGIVAVPIMAMMMVIVANARLMGRFRAGRRLVVLGWIGTGLMAAAVIALFGSFIAG